jgi:hypothetical protein
MAQELFFVLNVEVEVLDEFEDYIRPFVIEFIKLLVGENKVVESVESATPICKS